MTKLIIRCDGLITKPNDIYLMKNPFTGVWEVIADSDETIEKSRADGQLDAACQRIAELVRGNDRV